jgi:FkbM family methyltransferase
MQLNRIHKRAINAILGYFSLKISSTKIKEQIQVKDSHKNFLKFLSGRVDCVLYIGANQGQYYDTLKNYYKNADIYLYEPDPELVLKLKNKLKDEGNTIIRNVAVGDKPGKYPFYVTDFETNQKLSSSLLKMTKKHEEWSKDSKQISCINVDVVKLDDEKLEKYSSILLKIDVQGYEMNVLRGASMLLKEKIIAIDTEVSFQELYHEETNWLDLAKLLDDNQFSIFGLDPWGIYYKSHNELLQADLYYVRKNLFEK